MLRLQLFRCQAWSFLPPMMVPLPMKDADTSLNPAADACCPPTIEGTLATPANDRWSC